MGKLQGQGQRVKNNGTHGEVLSQGIKFQRERQNYRMTDSAKTSSTDLQPRGHKK